MPASTKPVVQSRLWTAVYAHPETPDKVEVTTKTLTEPPRKRTFRIAGGKAALVATSITSIAVPANEKESTMGATRTRPKPKNKPKPAPVDDDFTDVDDLDDLDGLDDLDVDDLADLDLDDEDVEEPEDESDEEDDEEGEDEALTADDLDDLDVDDLLDDEEDEEPAPPKRKQSSKPKPVPAKAKAPAAPKERPLTDAMQRMLKDAYRLKNGAAITNIGQQRTADSLIARKLVKFVPGAKGADNKPNAVESTVTGAKYLGKPKREPAVAKAAPKAAPAKSAPKKGSGQAKRPASRQTQRQAPPARTLPKGMVGVGAIAKHTKVAEETVRRVLRLNEDRFKQREGRWAFTRDEAREVIREVRSYVKYTGGTRGRPKGATTSLPDGKVGPSFIAEQAGCHRNTVYNFLRRHAERFDRFKSDDGMYLFTEAQADKIAAKLAH